MEQPYRSLPKPTGCELCGRNVDLLTKHHLIPRTRHRNKRNRREFTREEVRTRILWLCRPCHNHIHDVLTEKELEFDYNTRQALLEQPDIRRFIDWIRRKPAGFKPGSRTMRRSNGA
ncbi:MAG TPA: hypothetical protein VES89_10465 [Candidatus Competibacteraceae bacterium]|nr:hypothetical protein [Candidatus Competibacteraceae bacterium]